MQAEKALEAQGISTRVVNIHTLKPFDREIIIESAAKTKAIVTVEEQTIYGGLGSMVAEVLAEEGIAIKFRRIGLTDFAHGYGKHDEVKEENGIGQDAVVSLIKKLL